MIRLMVAEDHHVVRTALVALLNREDDLDVVHEVADGAAIMDGVRRFRPNLLLLDANMPNHKPAHCIQQVLEAFDDTTIVVLSAFDERQIVAQLLKAGASGYVVKDDSHDALLNAIRAVAAGGRWVSPKVVDALWLTNRAAADALTPRESEVLTLIAAGKRNQEIADELGVTYQSARNYVQRIYRKLDVDTRVEAVLYAQQHGLV